MRCRVRRVFMPSDTGTIVVGFVLPPLIALVVMLIAWRPWATMRYEMSDVDEQTRTAAHRLPRAWWGGAVGLGIAVIVAHLGVAPKLSWPPVGSYDYRFVAAVGITLFALLFALVRIPLSLMLSLRYVLSAGAITGVVWRRFVNEQWELGEGIVIIGLLALVVSAFWTMLEILADRLKGATPVVMLAILCFASAPVLLFDAAYESAAMGGAAMGIVTLAVVPLAWLRKPISLSRGGASVLGLMLPLLWIDAGVWQGGINAWQVGAFLLAPLGAVLCLIPFGRPRTRLRSLLAVGGVAILPIVVALETASRVNWREYGFDMDPLRGAVVEGEGEEEFDFSSYSR
ncbi:MAG: hypothetical protein ACNA8P_01590 [Phycisphaerales bacterium]